MADKIHQKLFGGEVASRERSKNHSKEIDLGGIGKKAAPIYVKYLDHVLFKNCNLAEAKPCIREVIGWLVSENSEGILICVDQPANPIAHEKIKATGLVILRNAILETHKARIKKPFNSSRISSSGHKKPYRMEK
jgi:hypothetical protein